MGRHQYVVLEAVEEEPDSTLEKSGVWSEDEPEDVPGEPASSHAADAPPPSKVPPAATMPAAAAAVVATGEGDELDELDEESGLDVSLEDASGESDTPDRIFHEDGVHLNSRSGCQ
jgi:hypothetical protein